MKMLLRLNGVRLLNAILAGVPCFFSLLFLALTPLVSVQAQSNYATPYTFTTLAGVPPSSGSIDGLGSAARFSGPSAVAVDSAGTIYVADVYNNTIRKITAAGVVTTLAGASGVVGSIDGVGTAAQFNLPLGVAVDSAGNVYVADTGNHTIRKITSAGMVTTLAGSAGNAGSINGTGSGAQFSSPRGVAADNTGNIFVADTGNNRIRKITPDGIVTTFSGNTSGSADGAGGIPQFNQPTGVALDGLGNVYVADFGNWTIRKITSTGIVTTLVQNPGGYGYGLAVDGAGNVYVPDINHYSVLKITATGDVTLLAGANNGYGWGSNDGTGAAARFSSPYSVALDGAGNVYVADSGNNAIRKVTAAGVVTTIAGIADNSGSTDGPSTTARFNQPGAIALDGSGNVYVADTVNFVIRKIASDGMVTTFAGKAGVSGSADGVGSAARFYGPSGIAVDAFGSLYVTDTGSHTIRKITSAGVVTTFAGLAGSAGSANGTGSAARFNVPYGVAVDSSGNVYVGDRDNRMIRKITAEGVVTTLAGGSGPVQDGTGTSAGFGGPAGVAVDGSGNVYVADYGSSSIRKVSAIGVVTTLAGIFGQGGWGDYPSTDIRFDLPGSVAVDATGNVYIADTYSCRIRAITPSGVVSTLAGGSAGSADGTGSMASFSYPWGIAVDAAGNVYVADTKNNTIRKGVPPAPVVPTISTQPGSQTITAGNSVTFTVNASGIPLPTYQWKFGGADITGATRSSYTIANVSSADAGNYTVVATNSFGATVSNTVVLTVTAVVVPPGVVAVSTTNQDSFFIKSGGTLWAMGRNSFGTLGDGTSIDRANPVNIAADVAATMGAFFLKADGTLLGMGGNSFGQLGDGTTISRTSPVLIASGVVSANGGAHSLFIKADGTLWAMGNNNYGQLGDGTLTDRTSPVQIATGVVAVATGSSHSLFIRYDGTLWAMGWNNHGQLGDGTTTARSTPVQITTGVMAVSAGPDSFHSLFVKSDGTLWATGWNGFGQIGDGTTVDHSTPTQIATGVMSVASSYDHSLFIKSDNTLWAMGANYYGQLGDGTLTNRSSPVSIASGVTFASASWGSSLFIKSAGTLWAMGDNTYGQLGDGTTFERHSPVQILNGALAIPSAPTGVTASENAMVNGIRITWNPTIEATGYEVWRNTANVASSATRIASNVSIPLFYDLTANEETTYYYWIKAVNSKGSSSFSGSDSGRFSRGPVFSTQPQSQTIPFGTSVTFNSVSASVPAPSFQWQKDGLDIAGATQSSYTIASVDVPDMGTYTVVATNSLGTATSNPATLVVAPAVPIITTQPVSRAAYVRTTAIFGVVATGWPAPTFQWRKNGTDVIGATSNLLTLVRAKLEDAGDYTVIVANSAGSVTSDIATLTIGGGPVVTTQPLGQTATTGSSVAFTVTADGWPAPTYQWQKNNVNIDGAVGTAYTIASATPSDAGIYTVVVTNEVGSVTSAGATLKVGMPPDGFDVAGYLTRYPTVAAVYGNNPYGAWLHYHDVGIYDGEVFDDLFRVEEYLALYPELLAIFGSDLGAALDHWLSTGRIEGKLGRIPLEFKAQGYFDRNPDVATAVGNDPVLAWGHYWLYGIYEGRAYDDELHVFEYLAINADLTAAFVNDWRQAALHWMRYGRTEGRLGRLPLTFNVSEYLVRSPDVAAVWGTNPTTVFLHYWAYGIDEGRTYDDIFRPVEYLALNPDLAVALGTDRRLAFKHWVRYGQTEGRPGRNP